MLKRISDDKIVQIAEDSPLEKARILEVDIDFCHSLLEAQLAADKKVVREMIEKTKKQIWNSYYISPENKPKVINGLESVWKKYLGE